jgi:hypothetical protein
LKVLAEINIKRENNGRKPTNTWFWKNKGETVFSFIADEVKVDFCDNLGW